MNRYVGSLLITGEAANVEEFIARMWDAWRGEPTAHEQIHVASPTIVNCGPVAPDEAAPS